MKIDRIIKTSKIYRWENQEKYHDYGFTAASGQQ